MAALTHDCPNPALEIFINGSFVKCAGEELMVKAQDFFRVGLLG
jgi:hypothetical protein